MTVDEVNRLYSDHLHSLRMSGLDFDEVDVLVAWDEALAQVNE